MFNSKKPLLLLQKKREKKALILLVWSNTESWRLKNEQGK